MKIQTRSEVSGLKVFETLKEAFDAASKDDSIWKISFTITETGERVRFIRDYLHWIYEPI